MLHAPPIHHSIDGAAACKAPARALQKVARVVVEKESTGRHVLLRVSSDRRGRSDYQSEPSEGPYTARTCTQGQRHRRPSCWLHPGGAATIGRGRPGAPLRLSCAGCGSDMLRSDLSAARQQAMSDPHSVCRLNHRFARDGLQACREAAARPASRRVERCCGRRSHVCKLQRRQRPRVGASDGR